MNQSQPFSILFPFINEAKYKSLSETTRHDLGLDSLVKCFSDKPDEQRLILEVLSHMTADVRVANIDGFKFKKSNVTKCKAGYGGVFGFKKIACVYRRNVIKYVCV